MFFKKLVIIQILASAVFFLDTAAAAPLSFNVDGVISDSSDQPLEAASVTFTVQVKDSNETCLLYEESFPVSMTGSNGYFSLAVGKQTNAVSGGTTLDNVFSNAGTAIPGQSCTYTPTAATETRKIIVSFNDGSGSQVFSAQDIQSVPYAVAAGQAAKFTGALSGDVSGSQSATVVGKIKGLPVDTTGITDGKILKYQSGSFVVSDDLQGSGGITSLNGLTTTTQSFNAIDLGNSVLAPAWVSSGSAHTLKIPMASGTSVTGGLISNSDFANFSTKITALTGDITASGSGSVNAVIGAGKVTSSHILDGTVVGADLDLSGTNSANADLLLKDASTGKFATFTCPTPNYVLTWTAAGWDCLAPATTGLPLSGGTMSGAINMNSNNLLNVGNLTMVAGGYLTLPNTAAPGSSAGQVWYDAGNIKYWDGSVVKTISTGSSGMSNALGAGLIWVGNASGGAEARSLTGDIFSVSNAGVVTLDKTTTGTANKVLSLDGSGVGTMSGVALVNTGTVTLSANTASNTYGLKLPAASPTGNQVMQVDALGNLSWIATPSFTMPALNSGLIWIGNASNGATAQAVTGDATIDQTGNLSLSNVGTAGTYFKVTTDAKGRVTSGAALASGDVTTALGYTPAAVANGYVNGGNTYAGNATIGLNDNYNLGFETNNTTQMTLTSGGSLGIGTASPGTYKTLIQGPAASNIFGVTDGVATAGVYIDNATGVAPQVQFGSVTNHKLGFFTNNNASSLTISTTGNIGIGNDFPAYSLDFNTKTDAIRLPVGSTAQQPANAAGLIRYNSTNSALEFNNGTSWNTLGVAGAGITTLNGLTNASQTFGWNSAGTDFSIASSSSGHIFSLPSASSSNRGALTSADWTTFNNKQSNALASGNLLVGNASGGAQGRTISGDITIDNVGFTTLKNVGTAGAYFKVNTDAQGRVVSGSALASGDVTTALGYTPTAAGSGYVNGGNSFGAAASIGTNDGFSLALKTNNLDRITITNTGKVGIGTGSPSTSLDLSFYSDAIYLPKGNTAARPGTPAAGMLRYSTTSNTLEYYDGTTWYSVANALGYTPLNKAGDTMSGDLSTQNITMAANKYLGLSANSTNGTVAGQMWYDAGTIKYFDGTTTKSLGVAGAGITSLNGLTAAVQTFSPVGTTGNSPAFSSSGSAHTLNIPMANTASVTAGLISKTEYDTFNAKQNNPLGSGQVWVGNSSGGAESRTLSGDIAAVSGVGLVTVDKTTTGVANKILSLDGSGVGLVRGLDIQTATGKVTFQTAGAFTNYVLTLPNTSGSANQVMANDGAGNLSWVTPLTSNTAFINGGNTYAGNATIGLNDSYNLGFETAGTTRMTLTGAGNLGIGTTSPGAYKTLIQGAAASNVLGISDGTATGAFYIDNTISGAPQVQFGSVSNHHIGFFTNNGSPTMTLSTGGNLGIGTGIPNYALDMTGRTDAIRLPSGTTVQQPGVAAGLFRYNTTNNLVEYTNGSAWNSLVDSGSTQTIAGGKTFSGVTAISNGILVNTSISLGTGTNTITAGNGNVATGNGGTSVAGGGQMYGAAYTSTSNTIDFNKGNSQSTNYDCAAGNITLNNMQSGGSYTLIVTSTTTNKCSLYDGGTLIADAQFTPTNTTRISSFPTVYKINKHGSSVYAHWYSVGYTAGAGSNFINGGNAFGGNSSIGLTDSYNLNFLTGAVNRMTITSAGNVGIGTTAPSSSLDLSAKTDAIAFPKGATASRPSTPVSGMVRYNNTNSMMEFYDGGGWYSLGKDLGYTPLNKAGDTMSGALNMNSTNITSVNMLGIGTASPSYSLDFAGKTDAIRLPAGTTAQQPANTAGLLRYNTNNNNVEFNNGSSWTALAVAGAGIASLNGLTTASQTFATPGTSGNAPAWSFAGSTHTLNIPMASAGGSVTAGLISNAEYATLSAKQSNALASGTVWVGNASGGAQSRVLSGDIASVSPVGLVTVNKTTTGQASTILSLDGSGVGTMMGLNLVNSGTVSIQAQSASNSYILRLPASSPSANQIMVSDSSGNLTWATNPALGYTPVNKAGDTMTGTLEVSGNIQTNQGQVYANQNLVSSGNTVDFNTGNVQIVTTPGGATINLNNMKDGGSYTVIVTDTASRQYTFGNCTNPHFVPANDLTTAGTQSIFTILKVTISGQTHCYISWVTGF